MSGHTPGPWRISAAPATKTRGVDILAGYSMTVASVPVKQFVKDDSEANARLIAAAPELLEALEALLNWERRNGLDESKPIAAKARAAIAKATGAA